MVEGHRVVEVCGGLWKAVERHGGLWRLVVEGRGVVENCKDLVTVVEDAVGAFSRRCTGAFQGKPAALTVHHGPVLGAQRMHWHYANPVCQPSLCGMWRSDRRCGSCCAPQSRERRALPPPVPPNDPTYAGFPSAQDLVETAEPAGFPHLSCLLQCAASSADEYPCILRVLGHAVAPSPNAPSESGGGGSRASAPAAAADPDGVPCVPGPPCAICCRHWSEV